MRYVMGYKGRSLMDTGYVYSPYMPFDDELPSSPFYIPPIKNSEDDKEIEIPPSVNRSTYQYPRNT